MKRWFMELIAKLIAIRTKEYIITIKDLDNYVKKDYFKFLMYIIQACQAKNGLFYNFKTLRMLFNVKDKTIKRWLVMLQADGFILYTIADDTYFPAVIIELKKDNLEYHSL